MFEINVNKKEKVADLTIYFVTTDWSVNEDITWDEGYYKAIEGLLVDIVSMDCAPPDEQAKYGWTGYLTSSKHMYGKMANTSRKTEN